MSTFANQLSNLMIQRIQSIFLLLVAAIMLAVLFLPLWADFKSDGSEQVTMTPLKLTYAQQDDFGNFTTISEKPTYYLFIIGLVAVGVAVFSIFQYRNRLTQMKLGALNSLLMGVFIGLTYFFAMKAENMIPGTVGQFQVGFFIVAAALLCNSLANRFIRKDEKLVRDADRIR